MAFELPGFLKGHVEKSHYNRWLGRKAQAHVKRDKKRFDKSFSVSDFQCRIHKAVENSYGNDFYTGKKLDWSKLSVYDNAKSKEHGLKYLRGFDDLPTVDHEFYPGTEEFVFRICGWITNDCKNRLTHDELIDFCESIIYHRNSK